MHARAPPMLASVFLALWIARAAAQNATSNCWAPQFGDYMNSGGGWLMFALGWILGVLVAALAAVLIANRKEAQAPQQAQLYQYLPVVYAPELTF